MRHKSHTMFQLIGLLIIATPSLSFIVEDNYYDNKIYTVPHGQVYSYRENEVDLDRKFETYYDEFEDEFFLEDKLEPRTVGLARNVTGNLITGLTLFSAPQNTLTFITNVTIGVSQIRVIDLD